LHGFDFKTSSIQTYEIGSNDFTLAERKDIENNGFRVAHPAEGRWGDEVKEQDIGVYLWASADDAHLWADMTQTHADIWEVRTKGLMVTKDTGLRYPESAYHCPFSISPARITRLGSHLVEF